MRKNGMPFQGYATTGHIVWGNKPPPFFVVTKWAYKPGATKLVKAADVKKAK